MSAYCLIRTFIVRNNKEEMLVETRGETILPENFDAKNFVPGKEILRKGNLITRLFQIMSY